MKRTIEKKVKLNRQEAEMLKKKAKKACLSEVGLIRFLIRGYEPREKPGDEFYDAMGKLSNFVDSIESLSHRLDMEDEMQMEILKKEIERWHCFQLDIEKRFLTPQECELKWQ